MERSEVIIALISFLAGCLAAVLLALVLWRCNGSAAVPLREDVRHVRHIDTVSVSVPMQPVVIRRMALRRDTGAFRHGTDTAEIARLLMQRDSLAALLNSMLVRPLYSADTVLAETSDTVHIECDDVRREASLSVRFGSRIVDVPHVMDSILVTRTIRKLPVLCIDVGIGVVATMQSIAPGIYLGISYPLIAIGP